MAAVNKNEYLTLSDIAQKAGISRATVYAHIKRGNLNTTRVGFFNVVTKDDAAKFLNRLTRITLGGREVTIYQ